MNTLPNILWIFSDQHSAATLGCYGDPNIETPNLDRLAEEGIRFTNAYSTCPLCAPFRATLYTGQYIHRHGVVSLFRPLLPSAGPQLPEVLRANGYRTSHMGKWHLGGGDCPGHYVSPYFRPGWDDWAGWENSNDPFHTAYSVGDHPHPVRTLNGYQTDGLTDLTEAWLHERAQESQPWFHVMSIEPPHNAMFPDNTYQAPEPYMATFRDRPLQLRPNFAGPDHPQRELLEKNLRGYYAAIKNLDDNVGRVLAVLEETGQLENTMIWYFSDHGDMMGSHGRQHKSRPEEESANIPLLIRLPDGEQAGTVSDALIGGVDFMPTLLGSLGIPVPDSVQGEDVSGLLDGTRSTGAESVLIQYEHPYYPREPEWTFRAIRSGQWLYSVSPLHQADLLFDLENDPFQQNNLMDHRGYAAVQGRLHEQLKHHLSRVGDDVAWVWR